LGEGLDYSTFGPKNLFTSKYPAVRAKAPKLPSVRPLGLMGSYFA